MQVKCDYTDLSCRGKMEIMKIFMTKANGKMVKNNGENQ